MEPPYVFQPLFLTHEEHICLVIEYVPIIPNTGRSSYKWRFLSCTCKSTAIHVESEISAELNLPMADSIILATSLAYEAVLWTQDSDFADIDGVKYIEKAK